MSLVRLVVMVVQAWIEGSNEPRGMQDSTSKGTSRRNICSEVVEQISIEEESPASHLAMCFRGSEPCQYLPCDGADLVSRSKILRKH